MNIDGEKNVEIKQSMERGSELNQLLGDSKAMRQLKDQLGNIASCDASVLITGESGTGKELVARGLHSLSSRCCKPFVPVNCGAIPENLFENELFGHRKGAFTDALAHQEGVVKEAEGGTLFLDEIGVITPYIQAKLLRLLQEKEYRPLGDSRNRKANARILAATNKDLLGMVKEDAFREDLFFRLNIVSLSIPPLRERKEDIPLLTAHFIETYSREYRKQPLKLSKEAALALISYSWPGNIRELENKIQHAIVLANPNSDRLTVKDLDLPPAATWDGKNYTSETFNEAKKKAIADFEKNYLLRIMTACGGDVNTAAIRTGKSRSGFWNLLSKYRLHPRQFVGISDSK
jgi:two-component system response regulator GlrR